MQSDTEHLAKLAGFHEISGGDIGDLPKENLAELKQLRTRKHTRLKAGLTLAKGVVWAPKD